MEAKSVGKSGNILALADLIHGYGRLSAAFETVDFGISFLGMLLAHPAIDPFTPQIEAATLQLPTHNTYDLRLGHSELHLDGFKRGAILPGHFDDAVNVVGIH